MTRDGSTRRAHIIGGSLGGLIVGIALQRIGFEVDIHERSPVPLAGRGAGIVSHPALLTALASIGIAVDVNTLGVRVDQRRVFDRHGTVVLERPFEQLLTSWDRLFDLLRNAFPDKHYHLNRTFISMDETADSVTAKFADGKAVTGDLLIGADGFRSSFRSCLLPGAEPAYAGYVAWRGLVDEKALSKTTHAALFDSFSFCLPEGEQMLGYPVAGAGNDISPGRRRYNLVWYRPASAAEGLPDLLTDATGTTHAISIPPPLIRKDVVAAMRAAANETLAPAFAEVVALSETPFFQPIYDYAAPQLVFGRSVLIGDAAFVVRPHVGAGVAKAAEDAVALAQAFAKTSCLQDALIAYENARLPMGKAIIDRARELGAYMQAQQASDEERRFAAENRTAEAVAEHTASLRFLGGQYDL